MVVKKGLSDFFKVWLLIDKTCSSRWPHTHMGGKNWPRLGIKIKDMKDGGGEMKVEGGRSRKT